ncbi:MAG: biotin transporter BioY [Clostridiales Family XIII bacterium]|jgi:biotin transport system substrate-specific component|nr:biotin transporter BioY [Clostridiales Family XIII bacterium]
MKAHKKPFVTTFELTLIAVFGAANCIIAPLSVPIGPVPVSLSVFMALLCGALLPPKIAVFSQLLRIILGAVGIPVFAGFQGGAQYLAGPVAGYTIATPFMALAVAFAANYCAHKAPSYSIKLVVMVSTCVVALLFDYALGTVWYCVVTHIEFLPALLVCVVPFIVVDILKIVAVLFIWIAIAKRLRRQFHY